jgi:hypothetical protein
MTYPNLAGVITKDDVYTKGTGSYAASYVAWAKIANHLHTHAPGWEFHLKPTQDGAHLWKAPDGTGYLIGYFTGPEDQATADFPFPVMDNRNNPVQYDKISARALTDAHRRALCACAAFSLSLGYELWAKEEVAEAGATPTETAPVSAPEAKAKPAIKKQVAPPADMVAPIDEGEYEIVIRSLTDLHSKTPEKIKELSAAFRKEYKLPGDASLSKQIKTQAHVQFINAFLAS